MGGSGEYRHQNPNTMAIPHQATGSCSGGVGTRAEQQRAPQRSTHDLEPGEFTVPARRDDPSSVTATSIPARARCRRRHARRHRPCKPHQDGDQRRSGSDACRYVYGAAVVRELHPSRPGGRDNGRIEARSTSRRLEAACVEGRPAVRGLVDLERAYSRWPAPDRYGGTRKTS